MEKLAHTSQIIGPETPVRVPSFLKRENGKLLFTNPAVPEDKRGPWDYVCDFGQTLDELRNPTDLAELRDLGPRVHLLEDLSKGEISPAFQLITQMANRFDFGNLSSNEQIFYTCAFIIGADPAIDMGLKHAGRNPVVLAPDRGGEILRIILQAKGVPKENMPLFRDSRVIFDGIYTIALKFEEDFHANGQKNILHIDDCGAAGGTEETDLAVWSKTLFAPEKYAAVSGIAVRRTIAKRAQELDDQINIDWQIISAAESNVMNDDFYLGLTDEERTVLELPETHVMRVNDMGDAMSLKSEKMQAYVPLFTALVKNPRLHDPILHLISKGLEDPNGIDRTAEMVIDYFDILQDASTTAK